jgi:hypothetical protein
MDHVNVLVNGQIADDMLPRIERSISRQGTHVGKLLTRELEGTMPLEADGLNYWPRRRSTPAAFPPDCWHVPRN